VELGCQDRFFLESWTSSSTVPAGHVERARIVLSVAAGAGTTQAAALVWVSRSTVIKWRDRFVAEGIAGLDDEPPWGRPKTVDDAGSRPRPWSRHQNVGRHGDRDPEARECRLRPGERAPKNRVPAGPRARRCRVPGHGDLPC
jgi:Winged helix-turn helix